MELLLIRHAEPIRLEVDEGPADPPLHERGIEQAARLATWLSGERLDAVYTSPLRRARETAAPVAEASALTAVVADAVAEYDRNFNWYVPVEELKALKDDRWHAMIGGAYFGEDEDRATFTARVVSGMEAIIANHPGEQVAVVCHGGVINVYLASVLGLTSNPMFFLPRYTSISRVAASRDGTRSLVSINEAAHLRG